jgi:UDP-N-acetylglucosamine:LPS N-acetylglucosamine transferase
MVNHLAKNDLQMALLQSAIIVCRSGYSTIMDLIKLHKHAFLIPTPGQTEQEYLATYLVEKKWFLSVSQAAFDINEAVMQFNAFTFEPFPEIATEGYKKAIDQLLQN